MNILAWVLSLSLMLYVLTQAVSFHQATVCRQKAWLKGTELITQTLLQRPSSTAQAVDIGCKVYVRRQQRKITWKRLPQLKSHKFEVRLSGKI